jgi:hypothetical protein
MVTARDQEARTIEIDGPSLSRHHGRVLEGGADVTGMDTGLNCEPFAELDSIDLVFTFGFLGIFSEQEFVVNTAIRSQNPK